MTNLPNSSITLSPQQAQAADLIGGWLKRREKPYFVLHGLAGTGKSTIANFLASLHNGPAYFMTFTGRAAQVLRKKGVPCTTIHNRIYLPLQEQQEEAHELEAELLEEGIDPKRVKQIRVRLEQLYSPNFTLRMESPFASNGLIVLDECSMVDKYLADDIMSFGLPVLVLGDPGQLPPIEGAGYFNKDPDFTLTEIHRQAKDSPIIYLAHRARKGEKLFPGDYGESKVIKKKNITQDLCLSIEQIACGRNSSRQEFNTDMRALRGFKGVFPNAGERLMCLRNSRDYGIFNGQVFETAQAFEEENEFQITLGLKTEREEFDDDTGEVRTVPDILDVRAHKACFTDPESLKSWSYNRRKIAQEFDYSYAATIHKLQGGQFDSVLVYPDLFQWDREKFAMLTYTGITRAVNRVVFVGSGE